VPVRGVDVAHAEENKQQHHRHLDGDDDRVECGRLPDADITNDRQRRDNGHCGNIDDRAGAYDIQITCALRKWRRREGRRQMHPDLVEKTDQVT